MIPARRLRLYLDTSVISHWDAGDRRGGITREFFRVVQVRPDEYELVVSPMTIQELTAAPDPKRRILFAAMQMMGCSELSEHDGAKDLAQLYISEGVLGASHINDLTHVAYAVLARCDCIISWNMRHLVHIRTIDRVNAVNFLFHYPGINIVTPEFITGVTFNDNV
ncbi:MAG: hypothetical protein FWD31_05210 [Planctomycetaceae bacterium]|nr:hypothetical protein [Planctomycetaceae bacterium]